MSLLSSEQTAIKVYDCTTEEEIKRMARKLRRRAAAGKIPATKQGRLWYFSPERLEKPSNVETPSLPFSFRLK